MKKNKTFIIAEAGVNHNGDVNLACKLIDEAVEAKADCVKFQTFNADETVSKNAEKAEYQKKMTGNTENQYEMIKKLELSYDDFIELKKYCDKKNIMFLSTPFDLPSIEFLDKLNMKFWKIPSGEITNLPYLIKIAETGKDIILSTGMANIEEIREAMELLNKHGAGSIKLLHCTTEYPAPISEINLNAIDTLKKEFSVEVGYSDHTEGIIVPAVAAAIGANIIEKHFTLDKNMEGPDHKASLNPEELKEMVKQIRNIEIAMGNGEKVPSLSEVKNIEIARKSIIAKKEIKKGEILSEENLAVRRPGKGISPMKWHKIVGSKAVRDFKIEEEIEI